MDLDEKIMTPELIVMLTHNDQTVADAQELFNRLKAAPVDHWGFKDVDLPEGQMKELVQDMNHAGKTTYLEVVSLSEEEGQDLLRGLVAQLRPFMKEYEGEAPLNRCQ